MGYSSACNCIFLGACRHTLPERLPPQASWPTSASPFDEIRRAAVRIRDPLAVFENDDLAVGGGPSAFAGGTQSAGIDPDDNKRFRWHMLMIESEKKSPVEGIGCS